MPHINNEGTGGADGGFEIPEPGPYQDSAETTDLRGMDADIMRQMDSINAKEGTGAAVTGNRVPALVNPVATYRPGPSGSGPGFEIRGGMLRYAGRSRDWESLRIVGADGRVVREFRREGSAAYSQAGIEPGLNSLVVSGSGYSWSNGFLPVLR